MLNKVRILFKSKDYSSAANMLRKSSEKLCINYLKPQEQLDRNYRPMNLDALLTKFIEKAKTEKVTNSLLNDLLAYKNNIMNPNSHYDIEQPLFKSELLSALDTLILLSEELNIEL